MSSKSNSDSKWDDRIVRHHEISAAVGALDDEALLAVVGSGGVVSVPGVDGPVFTKLLPLTELESRPENRHSTANLFRLPTVYQNRFGGCGFGAWRELELHRRANDWVTSGRCIGLTLLHAWRVLPIATRDVDDGAEFWGDHPAIRARADAVAASTRSIVLFLEHVPQNLHEHLAGRLRDDPEPAETIAAVERDMLRVIDFVNGAGVLHMDAHFENVLTDGDELFLTDHGLGIASDFDLGDDERAFFERHQNFDRCTVVAACVHALAQRYAGRESWRELLRGAEPRLTSVVPEPVRAYLEPRVPVAVAMGDYYRRLRADLSTPYPADELQRLLDAG